MWSFQAAAARQDSAATLAPIDPVDQVAVIGIADPVRLDRSASRICPAPARLGPQDAACRITTEQWSELGNASISITADVYGELVGAVVSDGANDAASLFAQTVLTPEGVSS